MKFGASYKLVGLVALAVSTAMFTSSLLGQAPSRRNQSRVSPNRLATTPAAGGPTTVVSVGSVEERPMNPAGAALLKPIGKNFNFDAMKIEVAGREVAVLAHARIPGGQTGKLYLWSLNVRDAQTTKVVLHNQYDEQVFSLPGVEGLRPVFSEKVTLAPGNYRFEIRLHEIRLDTDLQQHKTKLTLSVTDDPTAILSRLENITVEN